jgi:hypothetical protein
VKPMRTDKLQLQILLHTQTPVTVSLGNDDQLLHTPLFFCTKKLSSSIYADSKELRRQRQGYIVPKIERKY